jgi:hypothetical protein
LGELVDGVLQGKMAAECQAAGELRGDTGCASCRLKVDASDLEDARDDFDKVLGHAGGDPDGNLDEYERVGFVNGMDSLGSVIVCWSSTPQSIEPLFDVDWEPDEGVEGILEGAGIRRSKLKIW